MSAPTAKPGKVGIGSRLLSKPTCWACPSRPKRDGRWRLRDATSRRLRAGWRPTALPWGKPIASLARSGASTRRRRSGRYQAPAQLRAARKALVAAVLAMLAFAPAMAA